MTSFLSAGKLLAVSTLADRIEWILEHREGPGGKPWSARGLSTAAGLAQAHVGMMKRGDAKSVTGETLAAVARTAGVSLHWLTTGEGSPDTDDVAEPSHSDDEKPVRRNAIGWDDALPIAKLLQPTWPEWAWEKAGASAPYMIDGPITPQQIVSLARTAMEVASPAHAAKREARRAEIDAEEAEAMEAQQKLEAAHFAKQKKAAGK